MAQCPVDFPLLSAPRPCPSNRRLGALKTPGIRSRPPASSSCSSPSAMAAAILSAGRKQIHQRRPHHFPPPLSDSAFTSHPLNQLARTTWLKLRANALLQRYAPAKTGLRVLTPRGSGLRCSSCSFSTTTLRPLATAASHTTARPSFTSRPASSSRPTALLIKLFQIVDLLAA